MQNHRILSGLTILVMVVLIAAGWFLVAQPQLAAASTANTQLTDAQSKVAATEAAIAQLKSEQKNIPSLKKALAKLKLSIPSDVKSSDYVRGLNDLAAATGVTITGITVDNPKPYTPPVDPNATPAKTPGSTASPSPAPSSSASAAPAVPTQLSWTPVTDPSITSSNFVLIPVTVSTAGDWPTSLAFIKGLQTGTRLFLVTGLSFSHDAVHPTVLDTTITGYIYAIIDPNAPAGSDASDDDATPTPTPTPTVSTSPNPSGSSTPTPTTSPTP